jgi:hypothetical protein
MRVCRDGFIAFLQQKPPQGAEVVQKPAAAVQMVRELVKFELHQLQGLKAALEAGVGCGRKIGLDLLLGFEDRIEQQAHVLLGIFDAVKRGLRGSAQARGSLPCGKYLVRFYHPLNCCLSALGVFRYSTPLLNAGAV